MSCRSAGWIDPSLAGDTELCSLFYARRDLDLDLLNLAVAAIIDTSFTTLNRQPKRDTDLHRIVLSALRCPARVGAPPKKLTEQILAAEVAEDISHVDIAEDVFLGETLVKTSITKLVILTFFLRVGEHGISFC